MKKFLVPLSCALVLSLFPVVNPVSAASAASPLSVGIQTGYLYGNTSYSISEYYGTSGFQSKLEFPFETVMAGFNIVYRPDSGRNRKSVNFFLSWMTNLGSGSGKVKDSDWLSDDFDIDLVGSAHPGLDIYSESDMELRANIFEFRADIPVTRIRNIAIGPMVGFMHQRFTYDVLNVHQTGYGPYAADFTGSLRGLAGTYEVNYGMVYLGVSAGVSPGAAQDSSAVISLGVAPIVVAEDEDDHVLRYKFSNGSTTGEAFFASIGAKLHLDRNTFFSTSARYMRIFTEGTQKQYFYAGPDAGLRFSGIPDRIDSRQLLVSANLTFRLP